MSSRIETRHQLYLPIQERDKKISYKNRLHAPRWLVGLVGSVIAEWLVERAIGPYSWVTDW